MTFYLVVDAQGGPSVVVKGAARRASAVNAVVANRFTACELSEDEIWRLAKGDAPLIDLDEPESSTNSSAGDFSHSVAPAGEGDAMVASITSPEGFQLKPPVGDPVEMKTVFERMSEVVTNPLTPSDKSDQEHG